MERRIMQQVLYTVFNECDALRQAGQAEYAHDDSEAFANFNRVAEALGMDRKAVLLVYAQKHYDGIASYVAGHTSQREDVTGRINDLIVYLGLLRGMIEEERGNTEFFAQLAAQYEQSLQPQPQMTIDRRPIQQPAVGQARTFRPRPYAGPERVVSNPMGPASGGLVDEEPFINR